ncbi:MAG TPA: TIGR04100 family radical SAM protein [Methylomusa anaerophila]|uniref:Molybdenum cofactor biosynthesis protein A n=1 Tax=Methylomusa anaerophila TaxID=1930071 RepID=A0A348AEK2_9FIRM|nr:TIGR04100 family radical SAM protein [Methylomusa anaerophila]BBB89500.1 molybdenum cofactor biosynthesis protein A [Methylomusa anaerophila]HML90130.1 TIGR04100 family radical SAM protein [Methylomusa anaerophila]
MSMTITYELGSSLYINITNHCTNHCSFCVRNNPDGVASGIDLWLEREPTIDEVIEDIQKRQVAKYKEFVFCGYGEPMMRPYDTIEICKRLKEKYDIPIRINTNGHANLICGRDITPQLKGLVDSISISLNAANGENYQKICRSEYGEKAYDAILDFAAKCKKHVPNVVLSVVDVISREDIQTCQAIAQGIGVDFRIRPFAI